MTPLILQNTIVEEIKEITKGMLEDNPKDGLTGIRVFPQYLPDRKSYSDPDSFPFVAVRLTKGKNEIDQDSEAEIYLLIGNYDEKDDNQGQRLILNIIQRITEKFCKDTIVGGFFEYLGGELALQEESAAPYFFGAFATKWKFKGIEKENSFA